MGRFYHRSWRRRKVLALSLGAGVATALVLPAFGRDDSAAAQLDRAAKSSHMTEETVVWAKPPDADCVTDDGVATCDPRADRRRADRRTYRRSLRKQLAVDR